MYISSIKLSNFKNLNGEYKLSPHINLIIGSNGIGKTNFLESIYYLTHADSFRNNNERNLINRNSKLNFLKVEADAIFENEETKKFCYIISDEIGILRKKFTIDGNKHSYVNFLHKLPSILFLPKDIDLISGTPEGRRKEIDGFLSMIYPEFRKIDLEYSKILKNRNKLIKQLQEDKAQTQEIQYWNEGLVKTGAKIIGYRLQALLYFIPEVQKYARKLFDKDLQDLEFSYISKLVKNPHDSVKEIEDAFSNKINHNFQKELEAGMTLYGPQRDDIQISNLLGNIFDFASRGEQRLVSFIFKLVMFEYYKRKFLIKPVLLLDDIMSELDKNHRNKIEKILWNLNTQIVATSTSKDEFNRKFLGAVNNIAF